MKRNVESPTDVVCMISRIDFDKLTEQKRKEILPYYDAFQDSVIESRIISTGESTTIEIILLNSKVEETGTLLWQGIHDLISPGNAAYVEFHNFNNKGTMYIEKYLINTIVLSSMKDPRSIQTIKLTGCVEDEFLTDSNAENSEN